MTAADLVKEIQDLIFQGTTQPTAEVEVDIPADFINREEYGAGFKIGRVFAPAHGQVLYLEEK